LIKASRKLYGIVNEEKYAVFMLIVPKIRNIELWGKRKKSKVGG